MVRRQLAFQISCKIIPQKAIMPHFRSRLSYFLVTGPSVLHCMSSSAQAAAPGHTAATEGQVLHHPAIQGQTLQNYNKTSTGSVVESVLLLLVPFCPSGSIAVSMRDLTALTISRMLVTFMPSVPLSSTTGVARNVTSVRA